MENKENQVIIMATKDFVVGIGRTAVRKGSVRVVTLDSEEKFSTTSEDGHFFGMCSLNDGWVKVQRLYSKHYDSYAEWNGSAWEDKKTNAYFYTLEKATSNTYYPEKSTREQALEWWNNLTWNTQVKVGYDQGYGHIEVHNLDEKQIEEIWNKEVNGAKVAEIMGYTKPNQKQFKQLNVKIFNAYMDKFSLEDLKKMHYLLSIRIGIRKELDKYL